MLYNRKIQTEDRASSRRIALLIEKVDSLLTTEQSYELKTCVESYTKMCSMKTCVCILELLTNVYFMSPINLKVTRKIEKRKTKRVDLWMRKNLMFS